VKSFKVVWVQLKIALRLKVWPRRTVASWKWHLCGFGPSVWIIGLSTKHVSDLGQWLSFSIIDKVGRVALPCLSPLLTQLVPVREKEKLGVPAHKNWNSYALVLAPASKAREKKTFSHLSYLRYETGFIGHVG